MNETTVKKPIITSVIPTRERNMSKAMTNTHKEAATNRIKTKISTL
jgi:hypothetical protein